MTKNNSRFLIAMTLLALTALVPWFLFGLQGPFSDSTFLLENSAEKFGLRQVEPYHLLFTAGPAVFLTPLLFFIKNRWFFWIGSVFMALADMGGGWGMYYLLRQHVRHESSAWVCALLMMLHPFMQQLQFYWMTELLYITGLLAGLYYAANYFASPDKPRNLAYASVWLFEARLMRPQTDSIFLALAGIIAVHTLWRYRHRFDARSAGRSVLISLCALALPALLLSTPYRLLNYRRHHTWVLSQTFGFAYGFFIQFKSTYRPDNGPASEQMAEWCRTLLKNPASIIGKSRDDNIPAVASSECQSALSRGTMSYGGARAIAYAMTNDWQTSDRFSVKVAVEAIHSFWRDYINWGFRSSHYYFTGISENPTEWQAVFFSQNVQRRATPYVLKLDGGPVITQSWGGLAYQHPVLIRIYNLYRSIYRVAMTYSKKVTFVLLPALFWLVWRHYEEKTRWFLSLLAGSHLITGLTLAFIVGFHHRYSVPLDFFTLIYICLWIDLALTAYQNRRAREAVR